MPEAGLCQGGYEKFWLVLRGWTDYRPTENGNQWDNRLTQVYLETGCYHALCVVCQK